MNEPDIASALKPVVEALDKLGVPYYIGGSIASSAYGFARSTMDVALASALTPEHVRPLAKILGEAYYLDEKMILEAIRRSSSFNLIHLGTMFKIDVFLPRRSPHEVEALARRRKDSLAQEHGAAEVYLLSPEDVVLKKLSWFRAGGEISDNQWKDILGVLKVQGENLDFQYLRRWAGELRIGDLLEKAWRESDPAV